VRGTFPEEYVREPLRYSCQRAYELMDEFTYEEFEPEELTFVTILLPPLVFDGITLKGLYAAPGVDAIHLLLPRASEQFISIANSRWASYPWSSHADGYFVSYDNHDRINYFKISPLLRSTLR
jgi:hypothetical protein